MDGRSVGSLKSYTGLAAPEANKPPEASNLQGGPDLAARLVLVVTNVLQLSCMNQCSYK